MNPLPLYCTALLCWKTVSGVTFAAIAKDLDKPEVWTTALFFGQAKCDAETAKSLLEIMSIKSEGHVIYSTADDPTPKKYPAQAVIAGLTGRGMDSNGVYGMVARGGTADWPPKVGQS